MAQIIDRLKSVSIGAGGLRGGWRFIAFLASFALGLYGAPNTGNNGLPMDNHLLDVMFVGPPWLTGGPQGLEASWLIFPLLAAIFLLVHRLNPENRYQREAKAS